MKICYLILAHNNPNHFFRLVDAVSSPNSTLLVQLNAKSDISAFTSRAHHHKFDFCENRLPVTWGGFTTVEAILNLLTTAVSSYEPHDYYCLLSGVDYPLRPNSYIERYLERHKGKQFINTTKIPDPDAGKPIDRISKIFIDRELKADHILTRHLPDYFIDKINKRGIEREYHSAFNGYVPCGGSTWWAFTPDAVQYIFDFVADNPDLYNFYRSTFIPDESFFQTAIHNANRFSTQRNFSFADWSRSGQAHPAMFDGDHINALATNGLTVQDHYGAGEFLFARKFPDNSETLVERVQKELWLS